MIHEQTNSGGKIRRVAIIFAPHDSRHGEFLSYTSVYQAKNHIFYLEDIWAKRLDIADLNILGLIYT